jgi:acyl carrier protein
MECIMVDPAEFIDTLTRIFREELDDGKLTITMDTDQSGLENWDSLAHVRIVMGIEGAYGIQFDVSEIENIKSVREFYAAVNSHSTRG